jgi:hypothetical protein
MSNAPPLAYYYYAYVSCSVCYIIIGKFYQEAPHVARLVRRLRCDSCAKSYKDSAYLVPHVALGRPHRSRLEFLSVALILIPDLYPVSTQLSLSLSQDTQGEQRPSPTATARCTEDSDRPRRSSTTNGRPPSTSATRPTEGSGRPPRGGFCP